MRNGKGFSLLEVLIAVFILAIMSMMIWQITSNAYRGSEKTGRYNDIYQYARISLKKLTEDLAMAFLIGPAMQGKRPDGTVTFETGFTGEDQGDSDRVSFVSFSNIRTIKNEKRSDIVKVEYYVEQCPDTEERTSCLMRKESFQLDKDIKDTGSAFPIAKKVKRFNLEYYDPVKQEWRADWSTNDPVYMNKLPRAVRISIGFEEPRNEAEEMPFTTEVMLPMSAAPVEF